MKLLGTEIRISSEHVRLIGHVASRAPGHTIVPWAINEQEFRPPSSGVDSVEVYFEFPRRYEDFVADTADPFAIALLLPSMAAGEPLEITPGISETLLFELTNIRDVFHTWYPQFHRVSILTRAYDKPARVRASKAATFFSGGVDSFYTLLKRRSHDPLPAPLSHIIFMHGVEQRLENSSETASTQRRIEQIAQAAGVDHIVGETNLRTLFPLHWEKYYFGSALAATANALSKGLGYVCIPSSFTYNHQIPHGSTPLVDDRLSTEVLRVIHDGGEASRALKTRQIVDWDASLVLSNLRVCIDNRAGDFNCGQCYKCVRTAVALKAIGAWEHAKTFPNKSSSHWEKTVFNDHPILTKENLDLARERGVDDGLIKQLERIVRKANRYDSLAAFAKNSPLERLLPLFRRARARAGGGPRMH